MNALNPLDKLIGLIHSYEWSEMTLLQQAELIDAALPVLIYLNACAAEWDTFAGMEGTDATKVVLLMTAIKKLAKLKVTK